MVKELMQPGWYYGTLQRSKLVEARVVEGREKAPYFGLIWRLTYYAPTRDKEQNPQWQTGSDGKVAPLSQPVERTLKLFLSDKAESRSFDDLERLGFNGEFSRPVFSNLDKHGGAVLELSHDNVNGKIVEKLSLPRGAGGADADPEASAVVVARFSQRYKRAKGKAAEEAPAVPDTAPAPAPAPAASASQGPAPAQPSPADDDDDDEVPF